MYTQDQMQGGAGSGQRRIAAGRSADDLDAPSSPRAVRTAPSLERVVSQLLLVAEATGSLPRGDGLRQAPIADLQVQYAHVDTVTGDEPALQAPALSLLLGALLPAIRADRDLRALLEEVRCIGADGAMAERLCRALFGGGEAPPPPLSAPDEPESAALTHREIAVLREATRAVGQCDIAEKLGISSRTVGTHFENIYRKLGVNKPLQAVMKAIERGYIGLETLTQPCVHGAGGLAQRLVEGPSSAAYSEDSVQGSPDEGILEARNAAGTCADRAEVSRICADTGLLLLLFSAALAAYEAGGAAPEAGRSSLLGRLSISGEFQPFGGDFLCDARSIVVAPAHSQSRGFTPGHIFVADLQPAPHGLNGCRILEFTAAGRFVRCFAGARELRASLFGAVSLAFAGDGRLLATTGGLMAGIVAFTKGARRAERFAEGSFEFVSSSPGSHGGHVYAASPLGLHRFATGGQPVGEMIEWLSPGQCAGLAASDGGSVGALFRSGRGSRVELYNAEGTLHRVFAAPEGASSLACDARGLWVTACPEKGTVHWLDRMGKVVRTQSLPAGILPVEAAGCDGQSLIVRGRAL